MTAQHWLEGYNVPPYLEVLPPPQPAPRVEWNHSPSSSAPAAAAVAPSASSPPPPQPAQAEATAPPTPQAASGEKVELDRSVGGAGGATPAVDAPAAPTPTESAAVPEQPATPATTSSPADAAAPPRDGPPPAVPGVDAAEGVQTPPGGEGNGAPAAAPGLESAASSGSNWRGGGPKIKVNGCWLAAGGCWSRGAVERGVLCVTCCRTSPIPARPSWGCAPGRLLPRLELEPFYPWLSRGVLVAKTWFFCAVLHECGVGMGVVCVPARLACHPASLSACHV